MVSASVPGLDGTELTFIGRLVPFWKLYISWRMRKGYVHCVQQRRCGLAWRMIRKTSHLDRMTAFETVSKNGQ